jgi:hypothetical protein
MKANEDFIPWNILSIELENLEKAVNSDNRQLILATIKKLVPEYDSGKANDMLAYKNINTSV